MDADAMRRDFVGEDITAGAGGVSSLL